MIAQKCRSERVDQKCRSKVLLTRVGQKCRSEVLARSPRRHPAIRYCACHEIEATRSKVLRLSLEVSLPRTQSLPNCCTCHETQLRHFYDTRPRLARDCDETQIQMAQPCERATFQNTAFAQRNDMRRCNRHDSRTGAKKISASRLIEISYFAGTPMARPYVPLPDPLRTHAAAEATDPHSRFCCAFGKREWHPFGIRLLVPNKPPLVRWHTFCSQKTVDPKKGVRFRPGRSSPAVLARWAPGQRLCACSTQQTRTSCKPT